MNVSSLLFFKIWPLNELEALNDKVKEAVPHALTAFIYLMNYLDNLRQSFPTGTHHLQ